MKNPSRDSHLSDVDVGAIVASNEDVFVCVMDRESVVAASIKHTNTIIIV